ncbi:MAG: SDR family oxidoreductase [Polyangiaceae bacterium]|jgi:NADP-dependent 3-hydroxy acid dehydrogenase YdfG
MSTSVFAGKATIITGGASGIGAALAKQLARAGARLVLADRQVALAEKVAASIRADGGHATAVELDVRSLPAMSAVVDATFAQLGSVDYFFNNAGIGIGGEMDTYEPRDWDDVIDVNLRGVAYGIQAVYPRMIAQGSGHIVNTASVAGLLAVPGNGSYTATKHAVLAISKALRIEAKRHGVRVSALCPGAIRTPILTGGKYGRMNVPGLTEEAAAAMWARLRPMDVDVFAGKALRAVATNEAIIVIPRWWKAVWLLERLSPALSARLAESALERMRAQLTAASSRGKARVTESSDVRPPRGAGLPS